MQRQQIINSKKARSAGILLPLSNCSLTKDAITSIVLNHSLSRVITDVVIVRVCYFLAGLRIRTGKTRHQRQCEDTPGSHR